MFGGGEPMCHGSRALPAPTSDLESGPILGVAGHARDQSPQGPQRSLKKTKYLHSHLTTAPLI